MESKNHLESLMESRGIFCETTRNLGIKWNFRLIPNHVVENLKWRTPRRGGGVGGGKSLIKEERRHK